MYQAAQKTDDDFQVDDVFLSKANRKQSESILEQRDKAAAIYGIFSTVVLDKLKKVEASTLSSEHFYVDCNYITSEWIVFKLGHNFLFGKDLHGNIG